MKFIHYSSTRNPQILDVMTTYDYNGYFPKVQLSIFYRKSLHLLKICDFAETKIDTKSRVHCINTLWNFSLCKLKCMHHVSERFVLMKYIQNCIKENIAAPFLYNIIYVPYLSILMMTCLVIKA